MTCSGGANEPRAGSETDTHVVGLSLNNQNRNILYYERLCWANRSQVNTHR